jgi:hypothetical protein
MPSMTVAGCMERFHVRRGHEKKTGGNAGLAKLAAEAFDGATADVDGRFQASFGLMTSVVGEYAGGRLVDVVQIKGADLQTFLDEQGMEIAMESRRRWSTFLDDATGYNAKQRGDKAKEETKNISGAKSTINMAHKSLELSTSLDAEARQAILDRIDALQAVLDEGKSPTEGMIKKLKNLL